MWVNSLFLLDLTLTMLRALLVIFIISLFLSACTQRMTCPAFQSAYIYDKEELRKKFSYFQEDSTPKILTASKNKYLIAEAQPYRKKIRMIQTVPMRPVYITLPDSLKPEDQREPGDDGVIPGAELDLAARSVIDSIYIVDVPQPEEGPLEDSVYVISKDKEVRFLKYNTPDSLIYDASTGKYVPQKPKYTVVNITFNVDQDNYMWYLRDYLVLPDVRQARVQQENREAEAKQKSKKEKKGFFRNLFKKKKKKEPEPEEPTDLKPVDEEDTFDYIEESEQGKPPIEKEAEQPKGKKKKEKKPKKEKTPTKEPSSPAVEDDTPPIKVEEVEDGF